MSQGDTNLLPDQSNVDFFDVVHLSLQNEAVNHFLAA